MIMAKFFLSACIFTTLTVAMGRWQLEPDYYLAHGNHPKDECSDVILDVGDCISYLSGDKSTPKPSKECCKGLARVLDNNEECLCYAFEIAPSLGISINVSRAANMASLCHLTAPPISQCSTSVSPAPSPVTASLSPSTLPPTTAPAPVKPSPPFSAAPAPAPAPVSPSLPSSSPTPTPPSEPVAPTPSTEAPESAPPTTSGAMHIIQMPCLVSFAVIVVSFFFV